MSFITSIKEGNPSGEAHRQLLRFGSGTFTREKITVKIGSTVEAIAGFEYLNTFQGLLLNAVIGETVEVNGQIIGKDKKAIQGILSDYDITPVKVFGTKITVDFSMPSEKVRKLKDELESSSGHFLCGLSSGKNTLKTKTTFPKPGKLVEKFCRVKLPKDFKDNLLKELAIPGNISKKADIDTIYDIHSVKVDESLLKTNPVKARLESRRDITVKRHFTIDGDESDEEFRALV
jgi:hypothetical protein